MLYVDAVIKHCIQGANIISLYLDFPQDTLKGPRPKINFVGIPDSLDFMVFFVPPMCLPMGEDASVPQTNYTNTKRVKETQNFLLDSF